MVRNANTVVLHGNCYPVRVQPDRGNGHQALLHPFKGMQQRIVHQIGQYLSKRPRVTFQADAVGNRALNHMVGLAYGRSHGEQNFIDRFAQIKAAPIDAGLVHGDLFETRHQIRSVAQAPHQDTCTLLDGAYIFLQAGTRQAAPHLDHKRLGLVLQGSTLR